MTEKQTRFEEGTPSPKPNAKGIYHKEKKIKQLKTEDDIKKYEERMKAQKPITNSAKNHLQAVAIMKQIKLMKKLGIKSQVKD